MNFEVDDAGTAILVAMTGLFWFITFGTSASPSAAEMVIVLAFTLLTLTQTGTVSFGTTSEADRVQNEPDVTPATDGGDRSDDA